MNHEKLARLEKSFGGQRAFFKADSTFRDTLDLAVGHCRKTISLKTGRCSNKKHWSNWFSLNSVRYKGTPDMIRNRYGRKKGGLWCGSRDVRAVEAKHGGSYVTVQWVTFGMSGLTCDPSTQSSGRRH